MKTDSSHAQDVRGAFARPAGILPVLFLLAAIWALPAGPEDKTRSTLAVVFLSIVLEALPFMFIGSLAGGLIEAFVSRERMASFLPRRRWCAVFIAAAAGIVFPVCECAVVPVVRRLTGKGLPLSAAVGYLLGGPLVNPVVAVSTAMAYGFDWRVALMRLAAGYVIAVTIGLLMGWLFREVDALHPQACLQQRGGCSHRHCATIDVRSKPGGEAVFQDLPQAAAGTCGGCHGGAGRSWLDKVGAAFVHAADDFMAVGHYLVIGAFIAAVAQTLADRSSFVALNSVAGLPIAAMMALAVLLNLCSEADAFVAASFRGMMPLSGQLAFMLTGPLFDLKLLLMYQGLFRRRAIVALALMVLVAVAGVAQCLAWITGGA